jgi:serine/threonine protein kinase
MFPCILLGRFNEVRLARRKNIDVIDRQILQKLSPATTVAGSAPEYVSQAPPPPPSAHIRGGSSTAEHTPLSVSIMNRKKARGLSREDSSGSLFHMSLGSDDDDDDQEEMPPDDDTLIFGDFDDTKSSSIVEQDALQDSRGGRSDSLISVGEESTLSAFNEELTSNIYNGNNSNPWCALKLISKEIFWERVQTGKERGDALVREVLAQLLLQTQHLFGYVPSVSASAASLNASILSSSSPSDAVSHNPFVQLFSVFETQTGFALELELMESNDLFDQLSRDGVMSETRCKHIIAQLVDALSYCHRLGIAHRDVKLSNITFPRQQPPSDTIINPTEIDQRTLKSHYHYLKAPIAAVQSDSDELNEIPIVKLADFGMTGFVGKDRKLRGRCGTPGYVAPEILNAGVNEAYDMNVDMFSLGVVAYTLLCGYEPFYGDDPQDLLRANRCVEYEFHSPEWDHISLAAKDFIQCALTAHPQQRITAEEAKRHGWLQDLFIKYPSHSQYNYLLWHPSPTLSRMQRTTAPDSDEEASAVTILTPRTAAVLGMAASAPSTSASFLHSTSKGKMSSISSTNLTEYHTNTTTVNASSASRIPLVHLHYDTQLQLPPKQKKSDHVTSKHSVAIPTLELQTPHPQHSNNSNPHHLHHLQSPLRPTYCILS